MVSSNTNWFEPGGQAWVKAQQDYWQNWLRRMQVNPMAASPFPPLSESPFPGMQQPWPGTFVDAFEQWRQMFSPNEPELAKDFMQRTTEMGKSYLRMAEAFYKAGSEGNNANEEIVNSWLDTMQAGFKQWKEQLKSGFNIDMPEIFGFERIAMKSWQESADAMMRGLTPQDWEFPGFSAAMFPETGKAREQLDKMLGIPALGYGREKQEKIQRLVDLLVKYGEALKAYKIAFAGMGIRSIKAMRKRLGELQQPIDSMRGLYDFWVVVNEDVYSKFVMSDEYRIIYGDLVNTLMAVQQASNELMEDVYQAMNLPTRTDLEAISGKLQQTRRENRQLRKQLAALSGRLEQLEKAETQKSPRPGKRAASKKAAAQKDDLTQIKGIGPKMQEQLYAQGITAMEQLAAMSQQSVKNMEKAINATGKITREQWVRQARAMLRDDD